MSFNNIKAILLQEYYLTRKSLEVIMDLFFFSVMNLIILGYFALYLTSSENKIAAVYLLLGMMLWEVVRIGQYSMSVGALWNVWSRNLSNMFITPLKIRDYLIASMISGAAKAMLGLLAVAILSASIFEFNILDVGFTNLILHFVNLSIFSWSIGIFILGLVFRFGTRIQAIAWGLIYIFQPLAAVFYPVNILPDFLQKVAYLLPVTHTFESARLNLVNQSTDWYGVGIAFVINIVYLIISLWFFDLMFNQSKNSGQFARMEG